MNALDILHKRVLVGQPSSGFSQRDEVQEILVLEISPSGNWIKIQNDKGGKYWKLTSSIKVVEVLPSLDKPKK